MTRLLHPRSLVMGDASGQSGRSRKRSRAELSGSILSPVLWWKREEEFGNPDCGTTFAASGAETPYTPGQEVIDSSDKISTFMDCSGYSTKFRVMSPSAIVRNVGELYQRISAGYPIKRAYVDSPVRELKLQPPSPNKELESLSLNRTSVRVESADVVNSGHENQNDDMHVEVQNDNSAVLLRSRSMDNACYPGHRRSFDNGGPSATDTRLGGHINHVQCSSGSQWGMSDIEKTSCQSMSHGPVGRSRGKTLPASWERLSTLGDDESAITPIHFEPYFYRRRTSSSSSSASSTSSEPATASPEMVLLTSGMIYDFFEELCALSGMVEELCVPQSKCAGESIAIETLLSRLETKLDDEKLFPCSMPRPEHVTHLWERGVREVFRGLLRVYLHLYQFHWAHMESLQATDHLNTSCKRLLRFVEEAEFFPASFISHTQTLFMSYIGTLQ